MNVQPFGVNSPRAFNAYPRGEFDLESLTYRNPRRIKSPESKFTRTMKSISSFIKYHYKFHPYLVFFLALLFGVAILILVSSYESRIQTMSAYRRASIDSDSDSYPFSKLKNLVMVAGHSIYTSSSCGKFNKEDSWFLEPYQKHPGQAATFIDHIKEGVETASKDDSSLLLFSGGETRKDAGPRSEAQSYWLVADSNGWFGEQESVKQRALTEEHARDSFENLLFSVCRFRELTGTYPQNITVVSYDFKEERFAGLHRSAIGFPESRFNYVGTPASATAKESAKKGEELVRLQFEKDPYGCMGSLYRKKLKRDPFHRSIPYPNGCPEIRDLFRHCGPTPYSGPLPWVYNFL